MAFRSIFGPPGSEARRLDDPFTLARPADAANAPYLFLSCGDQESLLPVNREFAALLERQHFQYEFHVAQGGHNWNQWNKELPILFKRLRSSAFISGQ
jgi:S-formylglutathione hydrolase FrmB